MPCTVMIVSSRRVDWWPPIGGWGHGWRDARVGSTFSEIQLTIAWVGQANSVRKRIFQIFPPTLEQNSPTLDQNRPTLEQNRLTLYQNPPTLYQNFFFTKPDPATLVQIDLPWSKIQLPCTRKFFFHQVQPPTLHHLISSRVGEFSATLYLLTQLKVPWCRPSQTRPSN